MRILLVNKYYHLRSGTERCLFNTKRLLEAHGHTVEVFAMQHPRNEAATFAADFVPALDFHGLPRAARVTAALRVIWYPEAARRIARVVDAFRPDVVHLFNIYHHLSPAVLLPVARRGIPIVQTLNDYKLVCPNYLLYTEGAPCTRCRNRRYIQAVQHRCLGGSRAWSAVAAVEMTLHKALRVYERHVAAFIAPSAFVRATVEAFGIPARQVVEIPHFLFPDDFTPTPGDLGYCAYVGRLAEGKGLPTLIRAMRRVPRVSLRIVGDGPLRPTLEALVAAAGQTNVRFTGHLAGEALAHALAGARFTVLPSEWYEVFGLSILESLAMGKPVVGARIGAIPEVIAEGAEADGALFTPGAEDELAACVGRLWDDVAGTRRMGVNGQQKVRRQYGPEAHHARLAALYGRLTRP